MSNSRDVLVQRMDSYYILGRNLPLLPFELSREEYIYMATNCCPIINLVVIKERKQYQSHNDNDNDNDNEDVIRWNVIDPCNSLHYNELL